MHATVARAVHEIEREHGLSRVSDIATLRRKPPSLEPPDAPMGRRRHEVLCECRQVSGDAAEMHCTPRDPPRGWRRKPGISIRRT